MLGLHDNAEDFAPQHDVLREAHKTYRGVRLGRGWPVMATLVRVICGQKVTSVEAQRSWRSLCYTLGEPAPGPHPELRLAAHPKVLAGIPEYGYRPHGIDRQRAEVILRACQVAHRLRRVAAMPAVEAAKFLVKVRGIGPWTAWGTVEQTHGHADGVLIGDYHIPNLVCWALAGEPRGDDARMIALLEPYRGHRMRVVRLLERTVGHAPRYGPRRTIVPH
ncbi:MAG: 3-methyladenine DNA glycosylase/8-oxoguanine DNA glycosylase [Myxococcota bacterium]